MQPPTPVSKDSAAAGQSSVARSGSVNPGRASGSTALSGPVLSGKGIAKQISGPEGILTILHELDIEVHAGEAVAIVGPSGSGGRHGLPARQRSPAVGSG